MERQHNLDSLKCISAFLVLCLHVGYPTYDIRDNVTPIARIAVPIFLMISGYYYPSLKRNGRQWYYFRKIIWMTFWSNMLYLFKDVVMIIIFDKPINIDWEKFMDVIIFNEYIPGTSSHLWYFNALIYTILFVIICNKCVCKLYYLIPVLLISAYIISSIITNLLFYRNFLFFVLPYFLIGYYIRDNEQRIKSFLEKNLCSARNVLILLVLEMILLAIEVFIYKKVGLPVYRDLYFMTTPMVLTIFVGALYIFPNRKIKYISTIGQRYSAYIYIFHIFVMIILNILLHKTLHIYFYKLYYINVFIAFACTLIFTYVFLLLKDYIYSVVLNKH